MRVRGPSVERLPKLAELAGPHDVVAQSDVAKDHSIERA